MLLLLLLSDRTNVGGVLFVGVTIDIATTVVVVVIEVVVTADVVRRCSSDTSCQFQYSSFG